MRARRTVIACCLLAGAWLLIAAWQGYEHVRVRDASRAELILRARDISGALAVVIRSKGRFGFVRQGELEGTLEELTASSELESVALLNSAGEVTASAGSPIGMDLTEVVKGREHWLGGKALFVNLVALGTRAAPDGRDRRAPVIVPTDQEERRPWDGRQESGPRHQRRDDLLDAERLDTIRGLVTEEPLTAEQVDEFLSQLPPELLSDDVVRICQRALAGRPLTEETLNDTLAVIRSMYYSKRRGRPRGPSWPGDEEYRQLLEERGVHWFVVQVSTTGVRTSSNRDLQLRVIIVSVALVACVAAGLALRALERSSDLTIRLVRAQEMTTHLRELNMAAAGLVHETKNPLNLIRGLAQMIGREDELPESVKETAVRITDETDRVTGRLNQFLDYSRPIDPKLRPVDLGSLVEDVFHVLESDREDKAVRFEVSGPGLTVQADEEMLRQVLFNLLLNAVQAVGHGGEIEVRMAKQDGTAGLLEIHDDGPGIPEEVRDEIFRPYFTTTDDGMGLGLAVVHQIVLAHQWHIECSPSPFGGVCFRINGLAIT